MNYVVRQSLNKILLCAPTGTSSFTAVLCEWSGEFELCFGFLLSAFGVCVCAFVCVCVALHFCLLISIVSFVSPPPSHIQQDFIGVSWVGTIYIERTVEE
jgi:hypothetical protein